MAVTLEGGLTRCLSQLPDTLAIPLSIGCIIWAGEGIIWHRPEYIPRRCSRVGYTAAYYTGNSLKDRHCDVLALLHS